MRTIHRLIEGDAIDALKLLHDNSVDSIVTDPPYGLTSRAARRYSRFPGHRGKRRGFLGHAWDGALPDPAIWPEALRVLKPGGFLVASAAPRSYHRLAIHVEDAGFIIHDLIEWVTTQGMPKWFDVEREVEKLDPDSAAAWRGWGLNLKPAHEPMVLAQKPRAERTIAANLLRWGVGALNVHACRAPFLDEAEFVATQRHFPTRRKAFSGYRGNLPVGSEATRTGRYPADVVITEGDAIGEGGHVFSIDEIALNVVRTRKASRRERTLGGTVPNDHPTVKPVRLIRWLIRLTTRPGGLVLDPFAGSGTTGLAAQAEGCSSLLVEREPEYARTIRARLTTAGLSLDAPPPHAAHAFSAGADSPPTEGSSCSRFSASL